MSKYSVIRPGAGIVSTHRTLEAAEKSLERQRKGSAKQGGYCQDYIDGPLGRVADLVPGK